MLLFSAPFKWKASLNLWHNFWSRTFRWFHSYHTQLTMKININTIPTTNSIQRGFRFCKLSPLYTQDMKAGSQLRYIMCGTACVILAAHDYIYIDLMIICRQRRKSIESISRQIFYSSASLSKALTHVLNSLPASFIYMHVCASHVRYCRHHHYHHHYHHHHHHHHHHHLSLVYTILN